MFFCSRVRGVRLSNGEQILCPLVISACGYHNTFGKLLSPQVAVPARPRELSVRDSSGFIMCNIGIRGSAKELGLRCVNTWYHPVDDPAVAQRCDLVKGANRFFADPLSDDSEFPAMITFPSLKDRAWAQHFPEKTTCQILVLAEYEWFDRWKQEQSGKRSADYEQLKQKWSERCLRLLFRFFPQLRDRVEFADLSTPLTIEHYIREPRGGAIGLDVCPERFADPQVVQQLDMQTPVKGLWLTGQDTVLCGQPMVQIAGIFTALRITGLVGFLRFSAMSVRSALQWWLL